jgi:hypothetical protein
MNPVVSANAAMPIRRRRFAASAQTGTAIVGGGTYSPNRMSRLRIAAIGRVVSSGRPQCGHLGGNRIDAASTYALGIGAGRPRGPGYFGVESLSLSRNGTPSVSHLGAGAPFR